MDDFGDDFGPDFEDLFSQGEFLGLADNLDDFGYTDHIDYGWD
jgi:hypothetical protein